MTQTASAAAGNPSDDAADRAAVVFSGGGTGGHLFPGVAVVEELQALQPGRRVVFAGSQRDVEHSVLGRLGYEHHPLPVQPLSGLRRNPIRFLWRNGQALQRAFRLLKTVRPAVVVGLGGLASVPVVWAASRLQIPTLLLEQNVMPGRATRWLSRRATTVCASFAESVRHLPAGTQAIVTGNPVRPSIAALHRRPLAERGRVPPTLLILGGSQGASILNDALPAAVEQLGSSVAGWRIVHQTGVQHRDQVVERYAALGVNCLVEPLLDDMAHWYGRAEVVVSRAGATTLAELACGGCPTILVPYPHAADDHQTANARVYETTGAALVVGQQPQTDAVTAALTDSLAALLTDSGLRTRMREAMWNQAVPEAASRVAHVVEQAAGGGQ